MHIENVTVQFIFKIYIEGNNIFLISTDSFIFFEIFHTPNPIVHKQVITGVYFYANKLKYNIADLQTSSETSRFILDHCRFRWFAHYY